MLAISSAYAKYCTERFHPLPTEEQVTTLQRRLNVELPDDYRRFLLEFNGGVFDEPFIEPVQAGCPQDALTFLSGIAAPHRTAELGDPRTIDLFDDNDPPKILSTGDTATGEPIILDTAPGEGRGSIYLKQAFGDFYYLADGIEELFELLRDPPELADDDA